MLGQVFLGWTSTKQRIKSLTKGHNAMPLVSLKPATLRSRVQHSTTKSLRSWSELSAKAISSRRQKLSLAWKEWKVNSILKHLVILAGNHLHLHIHHSPIINTLPTGKFFMLFCRLLTFFKINFFKKNSFRNTIWVSNRLDPDQVRHFVGPDPVPICLQRLSADETSRHWI